MGQPRLVLLVPFGDARVEVPAVVIETRRFGELANLIERLALEHQKPDDDVGHLHAGVVDVVLHLDGHAAEPQHADERVPKGRIAQVADMCRLVRVDRRVLDDGFGTPGSWGGWVRTEPLHQKAPALQEEVEVSVRGRCDACHPLDGSKRSRDLLRNGPRRLSQPPGQVERHRCAQIAELAGRGVLERDRWCFGRSQGVQLLEQLLEMRPEAFVNGQDHA